MTDQSKPNEGFYPPPPPGPPPGHNGLAMHPTGNPIPDSHDELYDEPPPVQAQQTSQQTSQQTPHQPPPPDSDGAPQKVGWSQRLSTWGGKAATPFNVLANKLGSEAFLPSTMDKECEKAARILRSFCKDGIYTDAQAPETVEAPTTDADGRPTTAAAKPRKNRTLLSIPSKVINRAVGLAIFTTARAGFHVSGATGSGVLIARLPDGGWSPPSGIQVHSLGAGFMIGIDIYDCVVVINTREALEAFTKTRVSLGSDLAVVAGPWGAGGSVDFTAPPSQKGKGREGAATEPAATTDAEGRPVAPPSPAAAGGEKDPYEASSVPTVNEPAPERPAAGGGQSPGTPERSQSGSRERKPSALKQAMKQPTYSYVKSRGFYAGVQVDGTIVTERRDANAAFYGEPVPVQSILRGEVPQLSGRDAWAGAVRPLFDTIKGAEGWRGQQQGGQWANQQGPAPAPAPAHTPGGPAGAGSSSTYGHGGAPHQGYGYPTGFDPVSPAPAGPEGTPPAKPPRPAAGGVEGVAAGVQDMNLDGAGARSKAAEAAAEAEAGRQQEERERRELQQEEEEEAAAAALLRERRERASAQGRPVSMAPPYTEMAGPGESSRGDAAGGEELPPAYGEEGAAAASRGPGAGAAGDTKHPGGPSS